MITVITVITPSMPEALMFRRTLTVTAFAASAALAMAGPAAADDLQGNARFESPGVRVHDLSVLGAGCLVLGYCDGVTPATIANTPTVRRADRAGEPLAVLCRIGHGRADDDVFKVRLATGDQTLAARLTDPDGAGVVDGLVSARQIAGAPQVGACGPLD